MGSATGALVFAAPARGVDRLFELSMLGMVASGYLAVAGSGYLDTITLALTAIALIARAILLIRPLRFRFPALMVNVATLAYIGFYPIDYLLISKEFLPATVHLVIFLAVTKVLTAESERDFTYLKIIAFLELMAACMLNGRINFFAFLALFLLFAVGTFSTSEVRRAAQRDVRLVRAGFRGLQTRLSVLGIALSLGILGMTAGLFFFLPRTARAAFQHLVSERYHLPGFSNEVTLGQIGEVKSQSTTVMHVRFISSTWPANLKWRGMALAQFDGKRWFNDISARYDLIKVERNGMVRLIEDPKRPPVNERRIVYEVHEKDFGADTVFLAGIPEFLHISVPVIRRSASGSIRLPLGLTGGVTYTVNSYLEPLGPPEVRPDPLSALLRREYLELPPLDPRVPRLAREMTAGAIAPEMRAGMIEQRLRHDYGYTLKLLDREVEDPLAHFLFERKKGHCEYFASAMAVMLRSVDIPSRVVTGFQSGIYNRLSGLQLIRTSDAHSWVEAYIPGRGWTTYDPTPPDPSSGAESLWTKAALYLDAAETFWQDWVLNYDLDHQLLLATRMQESGRGSTWIDSVVVRLDHWRMFAADFLKHNGAPLAFAFLAIAAMILFGPSIRSAWRTRRRIRRVQRGEVDAADATLLYRRMLSLLERRGFEKPAWITPGEFARTLPPSDFSPLVDDLTDAYHELRYGGRPEAAPRMLTLLNRLEQLRRA